MPKILVRDLYERGSPRPSSFEMEATISNPRTSLRLRLEPDLDSVFCSFKFSTAALEDEVGSFEIELERTALHHGERTWFRCPGCDRRVGILYITTEVLDCSECNQLRYRSQIDRTEPVRTRARAIREKLGPALLLGGRPTRPKGMHRTTYERLCAELVRLETQERSRTGEVLSLRDVLTDALERSLRES